MAVTIKDVAKMANVAPSTVSRVISDNPRISQATKKRVRKAMEKLGYHPNVNARNLAVRSSQAIGVIMPSSAETALQNPFFPEVLRGIGSMALETEYSLYVSTGGDEKQSFEEVKRMVHGNRVDGIILLYSRENDPIMNFLMERKFPFVVVGKPYKNESQITYVDNDNVQACRELAEHLIKLGHERIAFLGGTTDLVVTIDRLEGYRQALKAENLPLKNEFIIHDEFQRSSGQKAVKQLFSLKEPPTAMIVADDLMSLGVINTIEVLDIECPRDVSIASFNNLYLSEITRPSLTTVDIQIYNLGIQSAKCLIEQLKDKDEPAKRVIVPHEIIYRNSTRQI